MTPVPPTPGGSYTPACGKFEWSASCFAAAFPLVLLEQDQVPVIPARLRHGLVGVVENGLPKRQIVPFHAGDFTSFAADAGGGVDEFRDGVFALGILAGHAARMSGDFLNA